MSMKRYEEKKFLLDVYHKLAEAEKELAEGKVLDGDASLQSIREKHFTHDQAKADAFANNPEVKKLYDEMEAEYKMIEQRIEARLAGSEE